eukprot:1492455-Prymnesium_polylepis.1
MRAPGRNPSAPRPREGGGGPFELVCVSAVALAQSLLFGAPSPRRNQSYSSPLTQIPQPLIQQILVQALRHNELI